MNNKYFLLPLLLAALFFSSCRKTEYVELNSPAYLRVFNCLDFTTSLDNKDAPQPFLAFLVDPVMDDYGVPVSAAITGDFLDQRSEWARPYPDAASNVLWQKEYPGTKRVLAAPIVNGYDLSSWAQVPSGKHRIIFRTRPLNNRPYFELDKIERGVTLIDTTIDLSAGEVYTMHALIAEYTSQRPFMYLRKETFPQQPFADATVYVNFYNLSAENFYEKAPNAVPNADLSNSKLRDTMNVYYSLNKLENNTLKPLPGYKGVPMGQVIHSLEPKVAPYYSFPLFADTSSNKIFTGNMSQLFGFYAAGFTPENLPYPGFIPVGVYSAVIMGDYGSSGRNFYLPFKVKCDLRTGLVVSIHSGTDNPRSFATVNTVEYINRKFYITTIQRKFAPPVY
ncbi:hypothetical protein ACTJJ0_20085 [Chitinophaga sp. 22321]|uniref:DUF5007 domain-containing protein n=1 Tax=Chitinophaga hostae TaxID=2831022 RepID=A0ABS5IX71_9BACT|nr:hypothetical protein [Chitinophaga hostae]MBS0027549.1 hypothetical protein [Chitinophaga hostae]